MENETDVTPAAETGAYDLAKIVRNRDFRQMMSDGQKIYKVKNLIRILSIVVLFAILMLLTFYGATVIATYEQAFPVMLGSEVKSISLCESGDMSLPISHLSMPVTEKLGDLSAGAIPDSVDSDEGGSHNGPGYLAYTFFIRNNLEGDITISEQIAIVSVSKNVDKAIRIRIYRNGVPTTYAAEAANGVPEYGTTPFVDRKTAVDSERVLDAGQIIRYTVVVWLEGDDPECTNDISGGTVRLSISFSTDY